MYKLIYTTVDTEKFTYIYTIPVGETLVIKQKNSEIDSDSKGAVAMLDEISTLQRLLILVYSL